MPRSTKGYGRTAWKKTRRRRRGKQKRLQRSKDCIKHQREINKILEK